MKTKAKKEAKKQSRKPVLPTRENCQKAKDAATVVDYHTPSIRKALACSWKEAQAIRHELLKGGV